jgi:hypothetical protein
MPYICSYLSHQRYPVNVEDLGMPAWQFMLKHVGPEFEYEEPEDGTINQCLMVKKKEGPLYFDYANRLRPLSDFVSNHDEVVYHICTPPTVKLRGNASPNAVSTNPDCPICFKPFCDQETGVFTFKCHHRVHALCYTKMGKNPMECPCPFCRA